MSFICHNCYKTVSELENVSKSTYCPECITKITNTKKWKLSANKLVKDCIKQGYTETQEGDYLTLIKGNSKIQLKLERLF